MLVNWTTWKKTICFSPICINTKYEFRIQESLCMFISTLLSSVEYGSLLPYNISLQNRSDYKTHGLRLGVFLTNSLQMFVLIQRIVVLYKTRVVFFGEQNFANVIKHECLMGVQSARLLVGKPGTGRFIGQEFIITIVCLILTVCNSR